MFCENCGEKLDKKDKFCEKCGFENEETESKKKSKTFTQFNWKISLVIICLALIGVGVWQFNHYFVIQKRSKVQSQINDLNKKVKELNASNSSLESSSDYWRNKVFDLEANPEVKYVPYQAPSYTPKTSTCNWIGNYYHCTYF